MMEKMMILGLGAQTKYVLETFTLSKEYEPAGIMMLEPGLPKFEHLYQVPILAWDEERLRSYQKEGISRAMVVHSNNQKKSKFMTKVMDLGFTLVNAIHPRACIATNVRLGYNVIINANAVIQPFAQVGNGVMIHAGVVLEHDNVIEDCVNLAPGATLAGWVLVREGAYIYTNATVIPTRRIGKHAIVGAGALVLQDVPDYAVVAGNPARIKKYLNNPA
jgi:sugar O-acyltransferase (sialic acid O-acetyltransferase NeuD family)